MGRAPSIPDLTVQEVSECLSLIEAGDEPRSSFCLGVLENSFPSVSVSDMIYWPDAGACNANLAAEIVRLSRELLPRLPST